MNKLAPKDYFQPHSIPKATQESKEYTIFLKRTLSKFLESSDLEWDELLSFACYCYNIFPSNSGPEAPCSLMFGHEPAEGWLTHLNYCSRYYRDDKGNIIVAELHKLWKHDAAYLKEIHNRKDDYTPFKPENNTKFKIGQQWLKTMPVRLLSLIFWMDYRVLK